MEYTSAWPTLSKAPLDLLQPNRGKIQSVTISLYIPNLNESEPRADVVYGPCGIDHKDQVEPHFESS